MNISDYNYSYANAIGNFLNEPLFKLISDIPITLNSKPWENLAWRITKVVFKCLVVLVLGIPAGMAWLLGKSIIYFSKTQIDYEGLHLAPPPIQFLKESDSSIDISILSKKYNALNIVEKKISKKECLTRLCDWIANENEQIYPDNPSQRHWFCNQVSLFLKLIISKLESGEVSEEKERDFLLELAEASTRCYPTWLEVSAKWYAEFHYQVETVEVKLLRHIQEYKESLILEFSQLEADVQWHALNYVRNLLGEELGLNTELNAFDPYAGTNNSIFNRTITRWLFLQRYEDVNRLIASVQTLINSREYDSSYHGFLVSTVKQRGIQNPEDFVAARFYGEDYKLNEAGANLMLRSIGILA